MLSIIIPVYNSEKYLKKCVDSILAQSFTDFELILIDDGSDDRSPVICDSYSAADARVRVVHTANGGVSTARNTGLDMARGDHVMFIDSDDWIEPDFCKNSMQQAERADLVIGGYVMIDKNGKKEFSPGNRTLCFPEQINESFDELYESNSLNTPVSKVYKRGILRDQHFDTAVALGEDFLFNLEYLSKCTKIITSHEVGYVYNCMNEGSATRRLRDNDVDQIVFLYRKGKQFLRTYCSDAVESVALKKRLCLNGINLIQLICYSDKTAEEKRTMTEKLLKSKDFIEACQQNYNLPFKYDFPRKLCARGNWNGLQCFFWAKGRINSLRER